MASVNYGRNAVADAELREVLQALCDSFQKNINVVRGDVIHPRKYIPPVDNWHNGNAVDFHVEGISDAAAYEKIKARHETIFSTKYGYDLFWHGQFTREKHSCLCISKFAESNIGTVRFFKGGDREENANQYWLDGEFHIFFGRGSYFGSMSAAAWRLR
jgi:hypothetical protein